MKLDMPSARFTLELQEKITDRILRSGWQLGQPLEDLVAATVEGFLECLEDFLDDGKPPTPEELKKRSRKICGLLEGLKKNTERGTPNAIAHDNGFDGALDEAIGMVRFELGE